MATSRDSIEMRLKLARAREFQRGVNKSARSIDNLGDQASQAARKMAKLNLASSKTRVSFGPFTTSMRFASVAVGGVIMATRSAIPAILGMGEAVATVTTGAGAAGLVWLTAFGQASIVAKSGLADLTDALGGNEAALKRLGPEARDLYNTLHSAQTGLRANINANLFPGLEEGAKAALKNLPVFNKIAGDTADALGDLGRGAGRMIGSGAWGRDIGDIGATNVKIIRNLGNAGLRLASAGRTIVHEAGPLAEWLSKLVLRGATLTDQWLEQERATGGLSRFFREARTDISLLLSATGHLTGGILNLFGHQDVDGTNTLRNLDRLTAKFDSWTQAIQGKPLGPEIQRQLELGLAAAASFLGSHIGQAGATAAGAFAQAFWAADIWGKGITAAWLLTKLGLTKGILGGAGKLLFGGIGAGAAGPGKGTKAGQMLAGRGSTPANPLFVAVINDLKTPGAGGVKGGYLKGALKGSAALAGALGPTAALFLGAKWLTDKYVTTPSESGNPETLRTKGPAAAPNSYGMQQWRRDAGLTGPNATNVPAGTAGLTPIPTLNVQNDITIHEPDGRTYRSTSRSVAKKGARRKVRAGSAAAVIPLFGNTVR